MDYNHLFIYEAETGLLRWRNKPSQNVKAGAVAGCIAKGHGNGYLVVEISGKRHYQHRIVWEMRYGSIPERMEIDHINRDRSDNRLDNLRLVSRSQNKRNYSKLVTNTSGCTGVTWHKTYNKWQATAYDRDGRRVYLGRFVSFDDAVAARKEAEVKFGYHENHGKEKVK